MIERLNAALSERYHLLEQIGEGGMATVYLADDLKHERKVALKVLKPELAAVVGAERFLAEIKTTANLQHPHILPLYDSGQADSFLFYVMPYVSGPTLRERLEEEKQLPVDEAVQVATAVAQALDFAHREGVVHRDIKPANILFQDGQPVVSDFGIALAVGAGRGARLTETGLSLGTPYYMSPEQATGDQQVGPRSDIYSLGCVLYEMLTGDPPYMGSTAQAVLGQIIAGEPVATTRRRGSVPPHIDAAILRTLAKLPADRFGTAQELVTALGNPAFRFGEDVAEGAGPGGRLWKVVAGVSAPVAVLALLALGWAGLRSGTPVHPEPREYRLEWPRPFNQVWGLGLSPDGSLMAWILFDSLSADGVGLGERRIWLQAWNGLEPVALAGTEGAWPLSFSPGGEQIAFVAGADVKVLDLEERGVTTVASGFDPWPTGLAWGEDGFIYASFNGSDRPTVLRFPETGGEIEEVTDTVPGRIHTSAFPLPDGRGILFTSRALSSDPTMDSIGVKDLRSGEQLMLAKGLYPAYLPPDHLVWQVDDQLVAAPFDPGTLRLTADPTPLRDGVWRFFGPPSGSVIIVEGAQSRVVPQLRWEYGDGTQETVDWPFEPGPLLIDVAFSPDGTRIAIAVPVSGEPGTYRIHVRNLLDSTEARLAQGVRLAWSEDGREVGFRGPGLEGDPEGYVRLFRQRADGSGPPVPISAPMRPNQMNLGRWSLDAPIVHGTPEGLAVLVPGQDTVSTLLMEDETGLDNPMLSPDGRWVALAYDVTGERRIFVRPYPDVASALYPVSLRPAVDPQWSRDGRILYYVADPEEGGDIVAARIEIDPQFRVVSRDPLFAYQRDWRLTSGGWLHEVEPGGERALISSWGSGGPPEVGGLVLIEDLNRVLEERVGGGG